MLKFTFHIFTHFFLLYYIYSGVFKPLIIDLDSKTSSFKPFFCFGTKKWSLYLLLQIILDVLDIILVVENPAKKYLMYKNCKLILFFVCVFCFSRGSKHTLFRFVFFLFDLFLLLYSFSSSFIYFSKIILCLCVCLFFC